MKPAAKRVELFDLGQWPLRRRRHANYHVLQTTIEGD